MYAYSRAGAAKTVRRESEAGEMSMKLEARAPAPRGARADEERTLEARRAGPISDAFSTVHVKSSKSACRDT